MQNNIKNVKKFYRYVYNSTHNITELQLDVYYMLRETPKGYWIVRDFMFSWGAEGCEMSKKWIPKVSKKRFAYPTIEEAKENYIARTKKYVLILEDRLREAKKGLYVATGDNNYLSGDVNNGHGNILPGMWDSCWDN